MRNSITVGTQKREKNNKHYSKSVRYFLILRKSHKLYMPEGPEDAVVPAQVGNSAAKRRDCHLHLSKVSSQSQFAAFSERSNETGMPHEQRHTASCHRQQAESKIGIILNLTPTVQVPSRQ